MKHVITVPGLDPGINRVISLQPADGGIKSGQDAIKEKPSAGFRLRVKERWSVPRGAATLIFTWGAERSTPASFRG